MWTKDYRLGDECRFIGWTLTGSENVGYWHQRNLSLGICIRRLARAEGTLLVLGLTSHGWFLMAKALSPSRGSRITTKPMNGGL